MTQGRETQLVRDIMVAVSNSGSRVFRNNVGLGWAGESVRQPNGGLFMPNPYPFKAGLCVGSSDLIGWTPTVIGGRKVAIFTAIEVKAPTGKVRPEQTAFLDTIRLSGGISCLAYSVDDALGAIKNGL